MPTGVLSAAFSGRRQAVRQYAGYITLRPTRAFFYLELAIDVGLSFCQNFWVSPNQLLRNLTSAILISDMPRIPAILLILAVVTSGVLLWYSQRDQQLATTDPNDIQLKALADFDQELVVFDREAAYSSQLVFALDDLLRDEVSATVTSDTLDEDLQALTNFDSEVSQQSADEDQAASSTLTIEEVRN